MELCLNFYEKTKDERKKHVSNIFYACDVNIFKKIKKYGIFIFFPICFIIFLTIKLDKNDSIEFYEFELMYKFVEKENYNR